MNDEPRPTRLQSVPEWMKVLGMIVMGGVTVIGAVVAIVLGVEQIGSRIDTLTIEVHTKWESQEQLQRTQFAYVNSRLDKIENAMASTQDIAAERARVEGIVRSMVKADSLR